MGATFTAIGRSEVAPEVAKIISILQNHKAINEKQLLQMVWRDVDASQFDNVMNTVIRSGFCVRQYKGPKAEKGIWYYYSQGKEE
jgi:hypothetical protein